MEENKNTVNNAENDAVNNAVNGAENDAVNNAVNGAENDAENDADSCAENDAESYDFMADAKATIYGLIDRTKEHGLFEQDEDNRVLVCMALDFDAEKSLFTANGKEEYVAVAIVAYIIENDLEEMVNKIFEMYDRGELKIHAECTEYENAEEVQDAEPAAENVGDE